jgi:hypothetical protein
MEFIEILLHDGLVSIASLINTIYGLGNQYPLTCSCFGVILCGVLAGFFRMVKEI